MPQAPGSTEATRPTALTTFTLKVDGQALPGTVSVIAVDITRELNRIPAARVTLYDGDAAQQKFEVSSSDLLLPGKSLEIMGGYSRKETLLFKGVITGQRIKVRRQGDSILHIEAHDAAFRLTLARKSRYFIDLTDSDLFAEILGDYAGLTGDVATTNITFPEIVQHQVSDWDLIVTRAEKVGLYCLPDNGTFRIAAPDLTQDPALELAYGQSIFNVDLELDARTQVAKVTASAWDPANQEPISAEVETVSAPSQGNLDGPNLAQVGAVESVELRHSGALQQQELDAWAEAQLLRSRFARIRGTVDCQGSERVTPGDLVQLAGLGDRFNGTAFVSGVRHMLGDGDWVMSLQIGMVPEWHYEKFPIQPAAGAGFQPAINGLHTGIVTQLQDDPAGEDRIQVRLPLINSGDPGIWSRLAAFDAGDDRGAVFRPEIDDEVVVGFVNDDPHEAVVLGMLHSSSKPAPISASDDNHEKGLVTRSGMKLLFNDDKPSLTIETPAGNTIVLDDDDGSLVITDENGNSLTLDSSGITMESANDITIKAQGDVSIEGINVTATASAAATLEGSASAKINSGGTTDVKGSLVRIN